MYGISLLSALLMMGMLQNYVWTDIYYIRHGYPTQTQLFSSLLLMLKKELGDGCSVRVTLAKTTDRTNTYFLHFLIKGVWRYLLSLPFLRVKTNEA
jgi:hypothetical protein